MPYEYCKTINSLPTRKSFQLKRKAFKDVRGNDICHMNCSFCTELQIMWFFFVDNCKIVFLFLNKNIHCDPSLESSR